MQRLAPVNWRTLAVIFEADGFKKEREKGSHVIYSKPGVLRPVVIPKYDDVGVDVIKANLRSARMSRELP